MEKQSFTETGLQALLTELYALPNDVLSEHAAALKHQPKLWINGHFELDTDQLSFLQNMPVAMSNFLGEQGSFAIGHRLPITLIKSYDENKNGDKPDKLFDTISSLSLQTDGQGQPTAGGELTIAITYANEP